MFENNAADFRRLKKQGLTLNMGMSVSGDPNLSNKVTDLAVLARRAFAAPGLTQSEKESRWKELTDFMDTLSIHDIGACCDDPRLSLDQTSEKNNTKSPNKIIKIYEDLEIAINAFFIPPGTGLPLHDHQQMTVFQKVLAGQMRYKDGDFDQTDKKTVGNITCTKLKPKDDIIVDNKTPTMIVTPDNGNVHEILEYGGEGCCFLDVLSPPYDAAEGRTCKFYESDFTGYGSITDIYDSADFGI